MVEKLKKYRWIFQLIISITLAIYIYRRVDFISLIASFKILPWYILLIVPIIGLLQVYITTIIQLKLFSIYTNEIGKTRTYKENFVAAFYGMAIPGLLGSDIYLVNYFGKRINNYFNAVTGIFFLRILGLVVFIVFVTVSFFFLRESTYKLISEFDLKISNTFLFVMIALILITIIGYFTLRKLFNNFLNKMLSKFAALINLIKTEKQKTFLIIFQIVIYYVVAIGGRTWIAKISGIDLSIVELSAVIMVVNLLIMLPISYSGIGVREGGYIGLLVLLSIDKNKAVLFSIMDFSITIFVFSVGAFIALIWSLIRGNKSVLYKLPRKK